MGQYNGLAIEVTDARDAYRASAILGGLAKVRAHTLM
jgi:hypothetical protein